MDHYPITLGVSRPQASKAGAGTTGSSSASGQIKLSQSLRQSVFERDQYTCACCGFISKKYQDILFKNANPNDQALGNLVTVCIFCHQCFNLDNVPIMRSGALIWLPEIDQATLHHIARAIYVARISQGPVADAARKALETLMARREEVKRRIQTDDPYILATVLRDYLSPGAYSLRDKKLEGVRLFPLDRRIIKEAELEFNQFPQILAYWRSKDGPFGGKTPPQWVSIYQNTLRAA
jgi:intracellular multiplication protein IcmJ